MHSYTILEKIAGTFQKSGKSYINKIRLEESLGTSILHKSGSFFKAGFSHILGGILILQQYSNTYFVKFLQF